MPTPWSICLEDLQALDSEVRFTRCVAIVGREAGLRLDRYARIRWHTEEDVALELWISSDDRLIVYRPKHTVDSSLERAGRVLALPQEKPVVAREGDVLEIQGQRLRIHVHGAAAEISPPEELPARPPRRLLRTAAVALAVGALGAGAGASPTASNAPSPSAPSAPSAPSPSPSASTSAEPDIVTDAGDEEASIEVRDFPPAPPPPRGGCCGHGPEY